MITVIFLDGKHAPLKYPDGFKTSTVPSPDRTYIRNLQGINVAMFPHNCGVYFLCEPKEIPGQIATTNELSNV